MAGNWGMVGGIRATGATLLAVWLVAIGGAAETRAGRLASAHRFADVEKAVRDTFAELPNHRADDIITQGEVVVALRQVRQAGWKIPEPEKVLERVLPDGDYLVAQLRTRHGRRFMSKVGGRKLMYDQLDRVSRVPGGKALVRDLPKLPDAAVQATQLEQFLPKMGSGRRRRVKDFNKPTGRIYTVDQLVAALRGLYNEKPGGRKQRD